MSRAYPFLRGDLYGIDAVTLSAMNSAAIKAGKPMDVTDETVKQFAPPEPAPQPFTKTADPTSPATPGPFDPAVAWGQIARQPLASPEAQQLARRAQGI